MVTYYSNPSNFLAFKQSIKRIEGVIIYGANVRDNVKTIREYKSQYACLNVVVQVQRRVIKSNRNWLSTSLRSGKLRQNKKILPVF